jgi:membrane fusion protein, multidrug efflux system
MAARRLKGAAAICAVVIGMTASARAQDLDGLIEPYEVVEISSQVPGVLEEVLVKRGDIVAEGQILARLKDDLEKIAVRLAQARLEFSVRQSKRNEELYESQLISQRDKDEIETEILINRLAHEDAEAKLAMRTIRSPIAGVVVERSLAPGESVAGRPVFTVAQINPLNVELIVPVERFGSVARGMKAEVRPEAAVGGVYTGTVTIVNQLVDAASGTFGIRIELPNPDHKLPAGLKCMVRILQ